MKDLCIFFNTKVENSGILTWIGDKGLAPFRYLCNGKTVRIVVRESDQETVIHHVASFHNEGDWNRSKTDRSLRSSSTNMIKTAVSILFLVPGLFLAVFKGAAYLFADVRAKHQLTKEHFTPINREIGSVSNPITTVEELWNAFRQAKTADPKNRPINALTIRGNGNLEILGDPGILWFNPMKLILDGARIINGTYGGFNPPLEDRMSESGKWQVPGVRVITPDDPNAAAAEVHRVNSIEEALAVEAPRRSMCKRYHLIFSLATRPQ